ncbi:hypothetical protein DMC30DRAFT_387981 [Rhodotorula diobovata]|uniref:C2H2-type domain-containing protein n=1 Tax=Rhodotorula diobovata TaxID=5288 RepID=A0A5C5G4Q0_9BASI|nr:hypothetical protein DMC30DRAFT_387981 [Rhodotorula diobovata]
MPDAQTDSILHRLSLTMTQTKVQIRPTAAPAIKRDLRTGQGALAAAPVKLVETDSDRDTDETASTSTPSSSDDDDDQSEDEDEEDEDEEGALAIDPRTRTYRSLPPGWTMRDLAQHQVDELRAFQQWRKANGVITKIPKLYCAVCLFDTGNNFKHFVPPENTAVNTLVNHLVGVHLQLRPYKCETCGHGFSKPEHLKRHKKSKTPCSKKTVSQLNKGFSTVGPEHTSAQGKGDKGKKRKERDGNSAGVRSYERASKKARE